jgi:hypothetical protein
VWTVQQANEALARITALVEAARVSASGARQHASDAAARASGNGHAKGRDAVHEVADVIEQLADEGIVLRDIDQGLIDFAAESPSGKPYWLCWVVGEVDVSWWHWPEDGFAGRTPISQPPK